MSDYTDDIDDGQEPQEQKRNWRRDLEDKAREADTAKAEADAAKRELAFIKAGIDLDSPGGKLLAKAYDGPPTAEAIKAAATEYGVLAPEAPAVPAAELAAHDRIADAHAGAQGPSEEDGYMAELDKAGDWLNGGSPGAVIDVLRKAGVPIETSKPGKWMRPEAASVVPVE